MTTDTYDYARFTPEATAQAAEHVAEGIRYMNHATIAQCPGLETPQDAERLLGHLHDAAKRLRQLLVQIQAHLAGLHDAGTLAGSQGRDPKVLIAQASYALGGAHGSAEDLAAGLKEAQRALSGLYVEDGEDA